MTTGDARHRSPLTMYTVAGSSAGLNTAWPTAPLRIRHPAIRIHHHQQRAAERGADAVYADHYPHGCVVIDALARCAAEIEKRLIAVVFVGGKRILSSARQGDTCSLFDCR